MLVRVITKEPVLVDEDGRAERLALHFCIADIFGISTCSASVPIQSA